MVGSIKENVPVRTAVVSQQRRYRFRQKKMFDLLEILSYFIFFLPVFTSFHCDLRLVSAEDCGLFLDLWIQGGVKKMPFSSVMDLNLKPQQGSRQMCSPIIFSVNTFSLNITDFQSGLIPVCWLFVCLFLQLSYTTSLICFPKWWSHEAFSSTLNLNDVVESPVLPGSWTFILNSSVRLKIDHKTVDQTMKIIFILTFSP